ncbi:MAG TPA: SGNH/GDSL hydrolase family protein [Streptosporangiaceae bacterium]
MLNERIYPAEAADPYCLRDGEADQLLAGHPWKRFAVVGDSIAEGLGEPLDGYRDEPWGDRIAAGLRQQQPGLAYLNLGKSMTRTAEVRAAQVPEALAFSPDLLLAACGSADMLLPGYDPARVERELRAIVAAFLDQGCDVITVGIFDGSYAQNIPKLFMNSRRMRIHEMATRTRKVAADLGTLHVELTWHPASHDANIYSSDPRHGTMRGHAIAAAETVRVLGAHLAARG